METQHGQKVHHHHILPDSIALTVGACLIVLTIITVAAAHVDLGRWNFFVAMVIATAKALLVALFFMNLKYDSRENGVIFATSFVFLAIFIVLTSTDLFFRGDVAVKPGDLQASAGGATSKLEKPWISSPELIAHGKELFQQQCVACHGPEGFGNGPAAAALNPHPRNFHSDENWKNGRTVAGVFKTLKNGLPPSAMASFATLPVDDRWALVHYVLSLGPTPPKESTPADFSAVGIDITKPGGGGAEVEKSIPIDVAMKRVEQPEETGLHVVAPARIETESTNVGARVYAMQCATCHGTRAEGGVVVKALGGYPKAYLTTRPLNSQAESMRSLESFKKVVLEGIPGDVMPGSGNLGTTELQELYGYVRGLAAGSK